MDVYAALADPVRRSLLVQLADEGACRVADLTAGRGISRPAVSRHLRVLGEAGLVRAQDVGRERHYRLEAAPLHEVVDYARRLAGAALAPPGGTAPAPPVGRAPAPPVGTGPAPPVGTGPAPPVGTAPAPPVGEHVLDALDLEVRRTVREHRPGEAPHTAATDDTEETA
ncbi:metalloregulator ArsR/SmtB family transcription factor [uncultured Serinicoccus sp.]|uniref:ArsR/SmtB family transcription factor n=1 Tax=uncultured Serinicoccus sp. TaxID=735514 RepID=UPI00260FD8EB|nr:metalloregulator ArsR/SmtB family transcription factor [uncultured Serinicoccus sp.]